MRFQYPLEPRGFPGVRRQPRRKALLAKRRGTVGGHDARDPLRMPGRQAHAHRTAEIVHEQRDAAQVQRQHESFEIVDVVLQPIAAIRRRIALAEPHVVRRELVDSV